MNKFRVIYEFETDSEIAKNLIKRLVGRLIAFSMSTPITEAIIKSEKLVNRRWKDIKDSV